MVSNPNQSRWSPHTLCHTTKMGIAAGLCAVLLGMYGLTWQTLAVLAVPPPADEFVIEVIERQGDGGHYPNRTVITSRENPLPPDLPITLRVSKSYGTFNPLSNHPYTIWIEADTSHRVGDQCIEVCGLRHTEMSFGALTPPGEASSQWEEQQCRPTLLPADSAAPDNL